MGIKESIWGALSGKPVAVPHKVFVEIRDAMLAELGKYDTTPHQSLFMKIFYAVDTESLWDKRAELLKALQDSLGEAEALLRLRAITARFVGYHPEARRSALLH